MRSVQATTSNLPTLPPRPSLDVFLLDRPDWIDSRIDDIVKLVARFVAAGGEDFITELAPGVTPA